MSVELMLTFVRPIAAFSQDPQVTEIHANSTEQAFTSCVLQLGICRLMLVPPHPLASRSGFRAADETSTDTHDGDRADV